MTSASAPAPGAIGAIADDFTGGTDVAVAFRRAGLRTVLLFGPPRPDEVLPPHDAVVVALKTRTIAPAEAVRLSVEAATWLRERGAEQFYFKYCSTFDSRPSGNIGPVADALAELLGASRVVVAPSSPDHLRTQYMGHLFVDRMLLSDSPMRHHPLTPMVDSSVPRLLRAQTSRPVSLIDLRMVRAGADRVRSLVADAPDRSYVVVDALSDSDLAEVGLACADDVLVTGAAGLAGGLGAARMHRLGARTAAGRPASAHPPSPAISAGSRSAVLAGSCSARTLEQVEHMRERHPSFLLDAVLTPDPQALARQALAWFDEQPADSTALIYSSIPSDRLAEVQRLLGVEGASEILETAMGRVARGLVERGVRRLVVAGGETSGAVVTALEVGGGVIGEEAAPGVPWIHSTGPVALDLLLKSGNFGDPELLTRSIRSTAQNGAAA
ncbi:four-carbon acid sugar kinase family protein [Herbiconiux sp. CPCC 203407]|uniref:3-oxo-tetronate kinase n=1 Tax=Herbiconiux oxytropis TaxID=2970915 RepID=A0AA41XHD4_9MICO|nr:3-oxo-tetronate kinase [Herbiconiux oxytropis]MCS5722553.1 four-carbon acid sugar kinase family protein [Herbiconiux oxytropis]MCS5726493.1 four-carbon acid sugar kinase family protein [Herbiconiux oxytropis]